MNIRHIRMLLTALGMMTLGAMEMYVPSVEKTSGMAKIVHPRMVGTILVQ